MFSPLVVKLTGDDIARFYHFVTGLSTTGYKKMTVKGSYDKHLRRFHTTHTIVSSINELITDKQKQELEGLLEIALQLQQTLLWSDQSKKSWKEKKAEVQVFGEATVDYMDAVMMTSDRVVADISINGLKSQACRLYAACGHKSINPQQLVLSILSKINPRLAKKLELEGQNGMEPRLQMTRIDDKQKVAAASLMEGMADYVESLN